jgi:hypothetical protein
MLSYWREIGIGIAAGTDNGQGNTWDSLYTVQNFGKLANSTPFITGVVYQDANGNGFTIRVKALPASASMWPDRIFSQSALLLAAIPCRCRVMGPIR